MHDRSSAGASAVPVADTVETAQPLMHQHALLQRLVDQQLDRDLIAMKSDRKSCRIVVYVGSG